ncbi:MAG: protein translocase subunit SecD [Chloroflexota bacterium]|nr:MAG: protein translocase subunit SecD [Chloroflexota bacterium]
MRRVWWTFIAIVVVFLAALFIDLPKTTDFFGLPVKVNKGIDIAGGIRLYMCAPANSHPSGSDMDTARDVIAQRAAGGYGVVEPQVTRVGSKCISVELPGVKDQNQQKLINVISQTGYLALTDSAATPLSDGTPVRLSCKVKGCAPGVSVGVTNPAAIPKPILQVVVPGSQVKGGSAQVGFDTNGGPTVNYSLKGSGSDAWCTYTTSHVGQFSAIVLDNKVVTDPKIQSAICGGQTQISGLTSVDDSKRIATYLNYGALPVPLHVDSSQQVSATLGPEYIREALVAGLTGLAIVALFMLLYYRLPGLLADVALLMYACAAFAIYKLFGVTFTLAGIAGFILSIGMAVDANVLIFERLREELRGGKTLGASVEAGFSRAFPAILNSNVSTIITCVILFWFGHNFAATIITGFALTLGLGVLVSFVTAYFVSKTFLRLLVQSGAARNPALYGVESVAGGRIA